MPSPNATNPTSLGSSSHFVTYAGAVVDTNLATEGGGQACRRIRANTAGSLVVTRESDGAQVTMNLLAGETVDICARSLVAAGSSATGITVFF